MPANIDNPNNHETKEYKPNFVILLSGGVTDSVTNITTTTETKRFTIKGKSFSVEEYVKEILVPLIQNKQGLMESFNAIPITSRGDTLATSLIESGFVKLAAFQIATFSGLDHTHAIAYVNAGFENPTRNNMKSFAKDEKVKVLQILNQSGLAPFDQMIALPGVDPKKLAIEWIKQGKSEEVFLHFSKLNIQDYDQFAREIITSSQQGGSIILENIKLFLELSSDIAWSIIQSDESSKYNVIDTILSNTVRFKNLDLEKIKTYLIENGMYKFILDKHEIFNMTITEAIQLALDEKSYFVILDSIRTDNNEKDSFYILNKVEKCLKTENRWDIIMDYHGLFSDIPVDEIIKGYIKHFGIDKFICYIPLIEYIDIDVAKALIQAGYIHEIGQNIEHFNIDEDICDNLIQAGYMNKILDIAIGELQSNSKVYYTIFSESVAVKLFKEGDFFRTRSSYFENLSTDFALSFLEKYSMDKALELISQRIECFSAFEKSFVEEIYTYYQGDEYHNPFPLEFLEKYTTSFSKEAREYIMMVFVIENQQDLLKKIKGAEDIKKMFQEYLRHFTGGSLNFINNFRNIYIQADSEKLDSFIRDNQELILKMMRTGGNTSGVQVNNITKNDISVCLYPRRNYSTRNIDDYSDQSQHLQKYTFNPKGYTFTLSNLLGYKLKEGMDLNRSLLEDYKTRVANITQISRDANSLSSALDNLTKVHGILLESTRLESRILEFLLKRQEFSEGITKEDFDILIAYQLMGRFEQFIKNSNDKLATSTDSATIHMVQILALLQEYGDPLKESVRKIEKIALEKDVNGENTSDASLLLKQFGRSVPKEVIDLTKDRIIDSMIGSFSQRPEDTITQSVIQKSILEKCKSVFQKTNIPREEQEEFAKSFSVQDFIGLKDTNNQNEFTRKWKEQVKQYFGSQETLSLNLRSIAKTQQSIYSALQQETQKFEEVIDKNGLESERHVFARFGKGKYDALARGVGDICLGTDAGMWKNPEYFELVLFDTDRLKCIGTIMLLNMPEPDDKKYLLYGPNPSVEFDDKVSSFKLFDQLSRIVTEFAQANNYDGVVFDPEHGRSTNRSGDFQTALEQSQLLGNDREIVQIDLKKDHLLGGDYEYRKDLSFLWRKNI